MQRWLTNGILLAGLWLFVRGVAASPERLVGEALIGLAIGLPIGFATRRFYGETTDLAGLGRLPYALFYLGIFLKELVIANLSVARIVLTPSLPIKPAVVEVPLRVESDLAIMTLANSITLTPGTLTMDYDSERNALYVHSINVRDPSSVIEPIRGWEDHALRVFDEEHEPDMTAPEPSLYDPPGGEDDG